MESKGGILHQAEDVRDLHLEAACSDPEIQVSGEWLVVECDQAVQETNTAFSEVAAAAQSLKQMLPSISRRLNTSQCGFHPPANEGIRDVRRIEVARLLLQGFPLVAKITGK